MKSTQSSLHGRSFARFAFERLETRWMLAQYGFEINLYADAGGVPAEPIAADTVEVGDAFFVEITAEDLRSDPKGLQSMGVHVGWDPEVLAFDGPFDPSAPGSSLVTESFPLYRSGKLDQNDGVIYNLRGGSSLSSDLGSPIGVDGPEQFALLRFRALETAEDSPLVVQASGSVGFIPMRSYTVSDLRFEAQTITVVAPVEAAADEFVTTLELAEASGPAVAEPPSAIGDATGAPSAAVETPLALPTVFEADGRGETAAAAEIQFPFPSKTLGSAAPAGPASEAMLFSDPPPIDRSDPPPSAVARQVAAEAIDAVLASAAAGRLLEDYSLHEIEAFLAAVAADWFHAKEQTPGEGETVGGATDAVWRDFGLLQT